ncbi:sulfiredoxin-like isoform x2 [Phaffia rhodozyma]|uniref:sulfiredoxin n=1 Tax=Phaffia rhodozyma TaxID=264483 RepID=A0A0F7SID4_PHARH|nr:sulfiredoxin-like isoform x2 [Phaffia rhodozyma]
MIPSSLPQEKVFEQNQDQNPAENKEESAEKDASKPSKYAGTGFSVFGQGITKIHDVPMNIIRRPIPSELDEEKVNVFMKEVARGDEFTPIEVLRVRDPLDSSKSYYYSVGGCHRFEAHKRLEKETIRGKIIEVPAGVMRPYLVNPPF